MTPDCTREQTQRPRFPVQYHSIPYIPRTARLYLSIRLTKHIPFRQPVHKMFQDLNIRNTVQLIIIYLDRNNPLAEKNAFLRLLKCLL